MNKRIEELANQYGIKTHIDILELFANEVYGDGVKAGVDKEVGSVLRDHFAGLAMQGYLSGYYAGGDSNIAIAEDSYQMANAMLTAREVEGDE